MINPNHIQDLRARIDLRDLTKSFPLLGHSSHSQDAGPCPKCGGVDRFHVKANTWFCNGCAPLPAKGKRKDVFDLILFLGLAHDFTGAVEYAERWLGGAVTPAPVATPPQPPVEERKPVDQKWLRNYVRGREADLPGAGMAYLVGRGIAAETAQQFGLGFNGKAKLPAGAGAASAIVIPWWDGDQVARVGLRYLESQAYTDPKGKTVTIKYRVMGAVEWRPDALFGLNALRPGAKVLAIVEGEINAMSVWQETDWNVISPGSQTVSAEQIVRIKAMATGHDLVVAWMDRADHAAALAAALAGHPHVIPVQSPNRGGVKFDANALLQHGFLRKFLRAVTGCTLPDPPPVQEKPLPDPLRLLGERHENSDSWLLRGAACRLLDYLDGRHGNWESAADAARLLNGAPLDVPRVARKLPSPMELNEIREFVHL